MDRENNDQVRPIHTVRVDSLRTARLELRPWRESDRAPFAEMNADPEVMRFYPAPLDRATSDELVDLLINRFTDQGFGLWAVQVRQSGQFIGYTGLNPMPAGVPGSGGLEIGWRLARHAWHQGYATEAARAVIDLAFDVVNLPELWSITAVLNTPSLALMRRLGMREYGAFDHPALPIGHPLRPHKAFHLTGGSQPGS